MFYCREEELRTMNRRYDIRKPSIAVRIRKASVSLPIKIMRMP